MAPAGGCPVTAHDFPHARPTGRSPQKARLSPESRCRRACSQKYRGYRDGRSPQHSQVNLHSGCCKRAGPAAKRRRWSWSSPTGFDGPILRLVADRARRGDLGSAVGHCGTLMRGTPISSASESPVDRGDGQSQRLATREGRFDYLPAGVDRGSTGCSKPLSAAEPRLGRRTALTFPLVPPPQKN